MNTAGQVAHGIQLGFKLFLEGQEVDLKGATVLGAKDQYGTCSIEIPAPPEPFEFEPRTLVHLFWWEDTPSVTPPTKAAAGQEAEYTLRDTPGDRVFADAWRLLFVGEALQYREVVRGDQQYLVLQCLDLTQYWEQILLYWGSKNPAVLSTKHAIAAGAQFFRNQGRRNGTTNDLVSLLAGRPVGRASLPGLLGGIVNLLEFGVGVYDVAGRNYRGVNDWASQAELRLHLTRMVATAPQDDTSATFLDVGGLRQYFRAVAQSVQYQASIGQLVQVMLGKIYHTRASVPAPPFMPGGSPVVLQRYVQGSDPNGGARSELGRLQEDARKLEETLAERLQEGERKAEKTRESGQTGVILDDWCAGSVVRDGESIRTTDDVEGHVGLARKAPESGLATPHEQLRAGIPADQRPGQQRIQRVATSLKETRTNQQQVADVRAALTDIATAVELVDEINLPTAENRGPDAPPERYTQHTTANIRRARQLLESAQARFRRVSRPMRLVKVKGSMRSHLNQTLLTPDLFMAPPPKCNVLFPDHYMSRSYGRDWMQETTRLILHGQYRSGQQTLKLWFSPNQTTGLIGPDGKTVQQAIEKGVNFLMRHELGTGPIPAFETIGDMEVFRRLNRKLTGSDTSKLYDPDEFMQRAANFLFIQRRLASRTMQIECRFLPQLVPGLTCLVLDRPDRENGIHYVGQIQAINHQIGPSGCSTSVTLIRCRRTDEGADLFGEGPYRHIRTKTKNIKSRTEILLGSRERMQQGQLDLAVRRIATKLGLPSERLTRAGAVVGPAQESRSRYETPGIALDSEGRNTTASREQYQYRYRTPQGRQYKVTVEEAQLPYEADGRIQTDAGYTETGEGTVDQDGQAYEVSVEHTKTSRVTRNVTIDFEQAFTPPWFAACYHPYNIGEQFYLPVLGCRACTDEPELAKANEQVQSDDLEPITGTVTIQATSGTDRVSIEVPAELVLQPARNTRQAAERLHRLYRTIKQAGADTRAFVDRYCARSYATLPDILGNPVTDISGSRQQNRWLRWSGRLLFRKESGLAIGTNAEAAFHADAFGDFENLASTYGGGLQAEPLARPNSDTRQFRTVDGRVDRRSTKYRAVARYREMLMFHKTRTDLE